MKFGNFSKLLIVLFWFGIGMVDSHLIAFQKIIIITTNKPKWANPKVMNNRV